MALTTQPDLILLDIMLPKMNGYEVCCSIRERELDIPIIMLTAKGQEEEIILPTFIPSATSATVSRSLSLPWKNLRRILYEMVAGWPPFARKTSADTMSAILHDDPPPLTDSSLALPGGFEDVIERCLMKNPQDRYASATDLRQALDRLVQA